MKLLQVHILNVRDHFDALLLQVQIQRNNEQQLVVEFKFNPVDHFKILCNDDCIWQREHLERFVCYLCIYHDPSIALFVCIL